MSSELGTRKTVRARLWPWVSGKRPYRSMSVNSFKLFPRSFGVRVYLEVEASPRTTRRSAAYSFALPDATCMCSSYPKRNFGGNQLLNGPTSLSPLHQNLMNDLHVSTTSSLHRSFLRLHPFQAYFTIFWVPQNYVKRVSTENPFGNEVYYTNSLILLSKNMLCSKLHRQKDLNSVLFSYEIGCTFWWKPPRAQPSAARSRAGSRWWARWASTPRACPSTL